MILSAEPEVSKVDLLGSFFERCNGRPITEQERAKTRKGWTEPRPICSAIPWEHRDPMAEMARAMTAALSRLATQKPQPAPSNNGMAERIGKLEQDIDAVARAVVGQNRGRRR